MSGPEFLRCELLEDLGIDHGLGTRGSGRAHVPRLAMAKQVHGSTLLRVPPLDPEACADALWTDEPGLAVGVCTADCVPILLVESRGRGVAALHAGWRGSAARICELGVAAFAIGIAADPSELIAVIGPHIGACCYEVDGPVRRFIADAAVFSPGRRDHYMLDLFALNRLQLLRAGVPPERILRVGGCTSCDPGLYASYRRDGAGERMVHFVRMPFP